jgi:hypothetical protein
MSLLLGPVLLRNFTPLTGRLTMVVPAVNVFHDHDSELPSRISMNFGFFELAQHLALLKPGANELAFFCGEVARVHATWQTRT